MLLRLHSEFIICLAHITCLMLTSNLWVNWHASGAMGTVFIFGYLLSEWRITTQPPNSSYCEIWFSHIVCFNCSHDSTSPHLINIWWMKFTPPAFLLNWLGRHHPQSSRPHIRQSSDRHRQKIILCRADIRGLLACLLCQGPSLDPPFPFWRIAKLANSQCLQVRLLQDTKLLILDHHKIPLSCKIFTLWIMISLQFKHHIIDFIAILILPS